MNFDLNKILVHCVKDEIEADVSLIWNLGIRDSCWFNIRLAQGGPAEAHKYFQIFVFIASQRLYADSIFEFLDPDRNVIQNRLHRENCSEVDRSLYERFQDLYNRRVQDLVIVGIRCTRFDIFE